MVSAALLSTIALVAASASPAGAFTCPPPPAAAAAVVGAARASVAGRLRAAADDASAQALSEYMARSHEEKLRAVKDVEAKKNSEIEALKAEIRQLKSSSGLVTAATSSPPAPSAPLAVSELESKLASYQSFMAEYIVNAQNQKLLAVKEAELKAEKKFQERLERLFEASGMALPEGVAPASAAAAAEETLFQKRNARIVAAAAAGKSRWGSMEVERAIEQAKGAPKPAVASAASTTSAPAASSLFEQRNARVAAAAAAGKSRWGDMEVERARNGAAAPAPAKASAAVSLEDRVNLGARLLGV